MYAPLDPTAKLVEYRALSGMLPMFVGDAGPGLFFCFAVKKVPLCVSGAFPPGLLEPAVIFPEKEKQCTGQNKECTAHVQYSSSRHTTRAPNEGSQQVGYAP